MWQGQGQCMSILCSALDLWCCVVTLCDVVRHQTKNALCPFIHGRHKIEMLDEEKIEDNFCRTYVRKLLQMNIPHICHFFYTGKIFGE